MSRLALASAAWLALAAAAQAQPAPDAARLAQGKQVFDYWCAACHAAGIGHPGSAALAFKYKNQKPALLEERTDLTPETTAFFVRHGSSVMPFFRKVEIGDADLDALGAYLARNAK